MGEQTDGQNAVKSADRVIDILEYIVRADGGLSHSVLSEALSIPKSSTTQLLKNLIGRGYVVLSDEQRTYHLGPAFYELCEQANQSRSLSEDAERVLASLTRDTGESSAFNILIDHESKIAATVLSSKRLMTLMRLGDRAPLYATSGGKAILAHMPEPFRSAYFETVDFQRITPQTLNDVRTLKAQIDTIRGGDFAYVQGEFTPGIVGIATPLLTRSGVVIGALSVAMPEVRCDKALRRSVEQGLLKARSALERRGTSQV